MTDVPVTDRAGAAPARVIDVRASRRALVAGALGNLVEWYEYALYGYLAPIIAVLFFPTGDGVAGLLATFTLFALAFFLRPVGAAIFGRLADRRGRRPVLVLIITVMSGATALIGVLPTYAVLGVWAPLLLTVLRGCRDSRPEASSAARCRSWSSTRRAGAAVSTGRGPSSRP